MRNKIKIIAQRIMFLIKASLPWVQAKKLYALNKYVETCLFKERVKDMGEQFAIAEYFKADWHFFSKRITLLEKLDILFRPYWYINQYKQKLQRYRIYIKQNLIS